MGNLSTDERRTGRCPANKGRQTGAYLIVPQREIHSTVIVHQQKQEKGDEYDASQRMRVDALQRAIRHQHYADILCNGELKCIVKVIKRQSKRLNTIGSTALSFRLSNLLMFSIPLTCAVMSARNRLFMQRVFLFDSY